MSKKNCPDEFWRDVTRLGMLLREKQESSQLYQPDISLDVVPGLYGIGVRFRSMNYPDHFIQHCNDKCSIANANDNDPEIMNHSKDVSWIPHEGIADPKESRLSQ